MKVKRAVAVHREDGTSVWYKPGDDMPLEDAQLVQNESVFEPEEMEELVQLDELPYENWTMQELQAECASRGLNPKGVKRALISRLEKFDAALEEEINNGG